MTNVFETYCFVLFVRYYETVGYILKAENLLNGNFRFRYNTNGYPWNYSYFVAYSAQTADKDNESLFEIRHNQKVSGAHAESYESNDIPPMFALDVAIIKPGSLPKLKQGQKRTDEKYWVDNTELITFAEAKKLTAYPMLLAQFLGIVHEVKPEFLGYKPEITGILQEQKHPPPLLFTTSYLSGGSKNVLQSFAKRNLRMSVVEDVLSSSEEVVLSKFG